MIADTVVALCMVTKLCTAPVIEALAEVAEARFIEETVESSPAPVLVRPPRTSRQRDASQPYRGMGNGTTDVEQWRGLVAQYFPPEQIENALCVMRYESGGNTNAKNPRSTARGLMQVLASLWAPAHGIAYDDLYDPVTNMRIARSIWNDWGWNAWSVWKKGKC